MKNNFLQIFLTIYLVFLASLIVVVGVGFVICALFFYLSLHLATWGAALATGSIVLFGMLILLLAVWLSRYLRATETTVSAPAPDQDFSDMSGLVHGLLKNSGLNPREVCMYAVVAGGLLVASPELRRLVFSLISEATTTKNSPESKDS